MSSSLALREKPSNATYIAKVVINPEGDGILMPGSDDDSWFGSVEVAWYGDRVKFTIKGATPAAITQAYLTGKNQDVIVEIAGAPEKNRPVAGSVHAMRFVFIHVPGGSVDTGRTQNIGYDHDHVLAALKRLEAQGHAVDVLDGSELSDEEREKFKPDVWGAFTPPHQKKGRKIGNSFGTNRYPWQDFGTGIPVLLVYDQGQCIDAYPHEEDDRTVTVVEYLTRKVT